MSRVGLARRMGLVRRVRFDAPFVDDALLAAALTVFAQLDLWFDIEAAEHYGPNLAVSLVTLVATAVLVLRRVAPLLTAGVVAVAVAGPQLFTLLTIQLWGDFLPLLLASYAVVRHGRGRAPVIGVALTAATLVVVELTVPSVGTTADIPFTWVPLVGAVAAARVLRARASAHAEVSTRAQRLEAERDETIRVAVAQERARIARELHDIVAHCVSVMVVQAGAAEDLLDRDPQRARQPLTTIQQTGQQAVAELGRMLGLLRAHGVGPAWAPQPGTAQLTELVEHMAQVGVRASLRIEGTPRTLSPGVELAAFRVVQEALTNTLKHAGSATVSVVLRYGEHDLELDIVDDGIDSGIDSRIDDGVDGQPVTGGNKVGHGLIGMRERVALYDGALHAGPCPDGGFAVRVRLPVGSTP